MKNESKKSVKTTAQESKSTHSSKSLTARKRLCRESSSDESKLEEAETIQAYERIDDTPFTFINTVSGKGMITISGMAVSTKEFKNIDEARAYLETKPWEVILIGTAVYIEALKAAREQAANTNNQKTN